jgi:hypothetical protein
MLLVLCIIILGEPNKATHMRIVITGAPSGYSSKTIYNLMFKDARKKVQTLMMGEMRLTLASCGNPWAEHLAISLYLSMPGSKLELFLSETYDFEKGEFTGTGTALNVLHRSFGKILENDTVSAPKRVKETGAHVETVPVSQVRVEKLFGDDENRHLLVYSPEPIAGFPRLVWNKWSGFLRHHIDTKKFKLEAAKIENPQD